MTTAEAVALATRFLAAGQLAQAEQLFQMVLQAQPANAEALFRLGVAADQSGRHELAVLWLRQTLAINPRLAPCYSVLGLAYLALGRLEQAIASGKEAARLMPNSPEVHYNLGSALHKQGLLRDAEAVYRESLRLRPGYVEALNNLGTVLAEQSRLQESEACYREAVRLKPDFVDARSNLSNVLEKQGRLQEAEENFREVLRLKPDFALVHYNLGNALQEQKRPDEAEACYREAVRLQPNFSEAHNNLGNVLRDQERLDEAECCFREAVRLQPDFSEALINLGHVLKDQERRDEADFIFREAARHQPDLTAPRVSLCMIVKDEEKNLPPCLESVADLVNEIVIVDTGSMDATKTVAARFQAKVVDFTWIDSFSAARNESLRHATGQWIFWMDADERLDADNREKLASLFASLQPENAAYSMKQLCLPEVQSDAAVVVDQIRLFRNHPALRWERRVHEQIVPAISRAKCDVRWTEVVIHHAGYLDAAVRNRKLQRDLRLLELEIAEQPDDPLTLFYLGSLYQELGRTSEALKLLRRSLELSHPSDTIVRKLYVHIANCHRSQGRLAEAVAACQEGRRVYPDDAELLFSESMLRHEQKDLDGAAACLTRLLEAKGENYFASVDTGLRGYKARHNLGVIYQHQGKLAEAEMQLRAVVAERPDAMIAWLALGDLYLMQQRWPELEETARRLENLPQGAKEAAALRGRAEAARHSAAHAAGSSPLARSREERKPSR